MVMIEVFTGLIPFNDKGDYAIYALLLKEERPPRPEHPALTDSLWEVMQRCWDDKPLSRPEASEVAKIMLNLGSEILEQLRNLDASSSGFGSELRDILYGELYIRYIPTLKDDDLSWLVDYLDRALDRLEPSSATSQKCLRELRDICGNKGILPTSCTPPPQNLKINADPFESGGHSDVYQGTCGGHTVCIKRIRMETGSNEREDLEELCKQAVTWKHLNHQNIVHLLWVTLKPLQLILDWMPGGNLPEYIEKYPHVNRVALLSDVANGLSYLHSRHIIHGKLIGRNVLVDNAGHARISDFAIAAVTKDPDLLGSSNSTGGYISQWCAPELSKTWKRTKESDVYSFSMVMVEIFTGKEPFSGKIISVAMFCVAEGKRPPRPDHPALTDRLWELMQRCWDKDPTLRPEASEVARIILNLGSDSLEQPRHAQKLSPGFNNQPHGTPGGDSSHAQFASPLEDVLIQPNLFLDLLDGDPLTIYVDEDTQDRDAIVDLIKSHGGNVLPSHGDSKYILVDPRHESGQGLYHQYLGKKGKFVLDVQWVHECIEAGALQTYSSNWAGRKVVGTETVS